MRHHHVYSSKHKGARPRTSAYFTVSHHKNVSTRIVVLGPAVFDTAELVTSGNFYDRCWMTKEWRSFLVMRRQNTRLDSKSLADHTICIAQKSRGGASFDKDSAKGTAFRGLIKFGQISMSGARIIFRPFIFP